MSTNNKSGLGCLPILGLTAIIAAGSAGTYYYFQGELPFFPTQKTTPLVAAEVIPESAFASAYLSINKNTFQQLSQYGNAQAKQEMQTRLEQWNDKTLAKKNISFEKDIQPWVDGVSIAFITPRETSTIPEDVQNLIVIGVKNKIKAKQFFDKLKGKENLTIETKEYQKIKIQNIQDSAGQNYSFALLDNRLVIAEQDYIVETAIDSFQGASSYADKPEVKELLKQSLSIKNPVVSIYIPDYEITIKQFLENTDQPIPETSLKQLDEVESILIGIGAEKQGLHLQAIANLNPNKVDTIPNIVPNKILSEFPGKTFLLANGQGIDQGWNQLVETAQEDEEVNSFVREIRNGFREINLDADQEIFNWMDGEFGLGIIELERGGIANLGVGGMVLLETSDRSTASNALNKLTQFARSNYNLQIQETSTDGIDVVEWMFPLQGVILSYGWLDNQNVMVTLGTSFEIIQGSKQQETLLKNPNFQEIKSLLPSKNLGYFYVDFSQIYEQLNQFPGETIPPESKPILASMKGLGMTISFPDNSTSQIDAVLSIPSQE
ncbi:DUF3352 domain-containing protein [Crocosphaera chwakensis]|uniref:DUF3352 domain-containing protein n=1 Tax=Crocosphaera chwakensis CCY0110 TaxID=391612 RepID=A3IM79_9CHRO|nr:DUF3352 domain-containing protein [Crocosphaera chwakensis]EAZ92535.1 hypothetical protein CY0110_02379 [Crocosphaera chwakensis CCY0110]